MSDTIENLEFVPLSDKEIKKTFISIYSENIAMLIGVSIFLTLLFCSSSDYYLLFVPLSTFFIPIYYFILFRKKCNTFITKISVNEPTQTINIKYLFKKQEREFNLKFGKYSILKRSINIKQLSHFEITLTGPYRILLKQYCIGDWESEKGYDILVKYAKKTTNQVYKPY